MWALGGLKRPASPLLIPAGAFDLNPGADPVAHAEVPRDPLEVSLDLGLRRVATRPAVGREGKLVEVRGDVAGGAGGGVAVPDAPDPLALLEHRHALVPSALQHPRRPDPAEAATDDGDRTRAAGGAVAPRHR